MIVWERLFWVTRLRWVKSWQWLWPFNLGAQITISGSIKFVSDSAGHCGRTERSWRAPQVSPEMCWQGQDSRLGPIKRAFTTNFARLAFRIPCGVLCLGNKHWKSVHFLGQRATHFADTKGRICKIKGTPPFSFRTNSLVLFQTNMYTSTWTYFSLIKILAYYSKKLVKKKECGCSPQLRAVMLNINIIFATKSCIISCDLSILTRICILSSWNLSSMMSK